MSTPTATSTEPAVLVLEDGRTFRLPELLRPADKQLLGL